MLHALFSSIRLGPRVLVLLAFLPPAFTQTLPGAAPSSLRFVENTGQWAHSARFIASSGLTTILADEQGFEVLCQEPGVEPTRQRFRFDGARTVRPRGHGQLPESHSFFVGQDPKRWRSGLPGYAGLAYPGLYPGVELRLRESRGRLEYDLLLDPGTDVGTVRVACPDVRSLRLGTDGGLLMETEQGLLRQTPPVTWCVLPGGEPLPLACSFVLHGPRTFGFRLADRDQGLPVVIDPGLEWATFLGGPSFDYQADVVRRPDGSLVVAGMTYGGIPTTLPSIGPAGNGMGYVSILDPTGSSLLASVVFGGALEPDSAQDVEVGATGDVFLTGWTESADFPVTGTALKSSIDGVYDAYVMRLSPNLDQLLYSSYLGGSSWDLAYELLQEEPAMVTLAGWSTSRDFPTTPGVIQSGSGGGGDFFLTRLDLDQPPAGQLLYSTYLGGSASDGWSGNSISSTQKTVDMVALQGGRVALVGPTASPDMPLAGAYQPFLAGVEDAYVAVLDLSLPGAAALEYATYLGGPGLDGLNAVTVDSAGRLVLGGMTFEDGVPLTAGAYQDQVLGLSDAWVVYLDPSLLPTDQLLYSTLLGSTEFDVVHDLACDSAGRIVATGFTGNSDLLASDFPVTCSGFQAEFGGSRDGVVFYLDPSGNGASDLLYSSFLGGAAWDALNNGVQILSEAPMPVIFAAGNSRSPDFPVTPSAYQSTFGGFVDVVLFQLELNPHSYCVAAANSFEPRGAILCGAGSTRIADNDFTLRVRSAVPGQTGIFYFGTQAIEVPFGNGLRCVGGSTFRLNPPATADAAGTDSRRIDFTSFPGSVIGGGTTWYAQYWYRDPMGGGAAFNLSNGLKTHFHP